MDLFSHEKREWETSSMVGTCSEMCPIGEVTERRAHNQLHALERNPMDPSDNSLMLKKYYRTMTAETLQMHYMRNRVGVARSMDRLREVMDRVDVPFESRASFIWDRYRAIWKDMTRQGWTDMFRVSVLEEMVRFMIFADFEVARCTNATADSLTYQDAYDAELGIQLLLQCLVTLSEIYQTMRDRCERCPNEFEFRVYHCLLQMTPVEGRDMEHSEIEAVFQHFPDPRELPAQDAKKLQQLHNLYGAMRNEQWDVISDEIWQFDFFEFSLGRRILKRFREVRLFKYFRQLRRRARLASQQPMPLHEFCNRFFLDRPNGVQFAQAYGLQLVGNGDDQVHVTIKDGCRRPTGRSVPAVGCGLVPWGFLTGEIKISDFVIQRPTTAYNPYLALKEWAVLVQTHRVSGHTAAVGQQLFWKKLNRLEVLNEIPQETSYDQHGTLIPFEFVIPFFRTVVTPAPMAQPPSESATDQIPEETRIGRVAHDREEQGTWRRPSVGSNAPQQGQTEPTTDPGLNQAVANLVGFKTVVEVDELEEGEISLEREHKSMNTTTSPHGVGDAQHQRHPSEQAQSTSKETDSPLLRDRIQKPSFPTIHRSVLGSNLHASEAGIAPQEANTAAPESREDHKEGRKTTRATEIETTDLYEGNLNYKGSGIKENASSTLCSRPTDIENSPTEHGSYVKTFQMATDVEACSENRTDQPRARKRRVEYGGPSTMALQELNGSEKQNTEREQRTGLFSAHRGKGGNGNDTPKTMEGARMARARKKRHKEEAISTAEIEVAYDDMGRHGASDARTQRSDNGEGCLELTKDFVLSDDRFRELVRKFEIGLTLKRKHAQPSVSVAVQCEPVEEEATNPIPFLTPARTDLYVPEDATERWLWHRDRYVSRQVSAQSLLNLEHQFYESYGERCEQLRLFEDGLEPGWMIRPDEKEKLKDVEAPWNEPMIIPCTFPPRMTENDLQEGVRLHSSVKRSLISSELAAKICMNSDDSACSCDFVLLFDGELSKPTLPLNWILHRVFGDLQTTEVNETVESFIERQRKELNYSFHRVDIASLSDEDEWRIQTASALFLLLDNPLRVFSVLDDLKDILQRFSSERPPIVMYDALLRPQGITHQDAFLEPRDDALVDLNAEVEGRSEIASTGAVILPITEFLEVVVRSVFTSFRDKWKDYFLTSCAQRKRWSLKEDSREAQIYDPLEHAFECIREWIVVKDKTDAFAFDPLTVEDEDALMNQWAEEWKGIKAYGEMMRIDDPDDLFEVIRARDEGMDGEPNEVRDQSPCCEDDISASLNNDRRQTFRNTRKRKNRRH